MVAPLLDVYQRRGYCTLYIDSKPVSQVKTSVRDRVKIKFDTKLRNNSAKNVKFCKHIDENPWNDCNPVDCDTYYNDKRSYYSARKHRCIEVPICLSNQNSLPKAVYNPVSNECSDKSALSKNDLDYIKALTLNHTRRLTKEVLILQVKPNFDITTLPSNITYKEIDTERILNTMLEDRPTELKVKDMQTLIKQKEQTDEEAKAKVKAKANAKEKAVTIAKTKSKKMAKATTKAVTKTKAKVEAKAKQKIDTVKNNALNNAKEEELKIEKLVKLFKYLKCNRYILLVLFCVCFVQCCFICTLVYCMTKNCLCGKQKLVVHRYFNRQHDASITTPLIATSNMDTDTTECQFMSESSNYIEKRIKCYKACQKDNTHNMKLSMSDDIISKYTTGPNWNRLPRSGMIPEAKTNEDRKITRKVRSDYKSITEMKVNFLDNCEDSKCNVRRIIVKRDDDNPNNKKKHLSDCSERPIIFQNYNVANNSKVSINTIQNYSDSRISGQKHTKSDSIQKSAQASFTNDSIDEYLSEKGIMCVDDIASKCSYTSTSTAAKSTATNKSSRTSKSNILKNFMSLLPKKAKGPSSDPGVKKTSSDLDLELLYVSRISLCSSFETDEGKDRIKNS